ncbi:MAG TPA: glutathione ABC transporter permease GsiC, partial [Candidatus Atribacteria bacterium]|nr:glutathione ABC transporter permease GsiC [Candidatus Atribacteria bacterium]
MSTYIIRRLLLLIPILIGVTLITFILMRIIPGDPVLQLMDPRAAHVDPEVAEKIRAYWGLDKPAYIQYAKFIWNALHGHL